MSNIFEAYLKNCNFLMESSFEKSKLDLDGWVNHFLNDDGIKGKPVSDADIKKAEKELGLKFSKEYIYFLKTYGWVSTKYGEEFLGIKPNNEGNDLIKITKEYRKEYAFLKKNLYVIQDTMANDGYISLQDSSGTIFSLRDGNDYVNKFASNLSDYFSKMMY